MSENIFKYTQQQSNLTSLNRPNSLKLFSHPQDVFKNSDLKHILGQPYAVINSPQFEKFLSQLPTPSPLTPTRFLNPNIVTQEEESFANDFTEKLFQIKQERESQIIDTVSNHLTDISQNRPDYDENSMSNDSLAYNLAPNNTSCQPPSGPTVNLLGHPASHRSSSIASSTTDQCSSNDIGCGGHLHKIKLERKRARNRDAARKCRERKLERIEQLEKQKNELIENNKALQRRISEYANEVQNLKRFVMNNLKGSPKKL